MLFVEAYAALALLVASVYCVLGLNARVTYLVESALQTRRVCFLVLPQRARS